MRRPIIITCAVLLLVGVAVGALWSSLQETRSRTTQAEAEIAALRESEARRRPSATPRDAPALCGRLRVSSRGDVADPELDELSGLVADRRTRGLFWAIEDSGAAPVLSAFREDGSTVGDWAVAGAENVDWEDLAAGAGAAAGTSVLYAADIGDNDAVRDSVSVYRVAVPTSPIGGGTTLPAERLELRYPDGPHDAETLLVDPRRGTLVIVTKGLSGGTAYAISPPLPFGGSATLREIGPISVPLATAGDISADGRTIAVRGYFSLSVWQRRGSEAITQTLRREPCTSPTGLSDGQGEAIALSRGGTTAWTVAEGSNPGVLRLSAAR